MNKKFNIHISQEVALTLKDFTGIVFRYDKTFVVFKCMLIYIVEKIKLLFQIFNHINTEALKTLERHSL